MGIFPLFFAFVYISGFFSHPHHTNSLVKKSQFVNKIMHHSGVLSRSFFIEQMWYFGGSSAYGDK